MRITGGEFCGRSLHAPRTLRARPASDRFRVNIFNILGNNCEGMSVLDLFAGIGTLGLETLSRGAETVTFVDYSHQSLTYLRKNSDFCQERIKIFPTDFRAALKALKAKKLVFDLIFVDPPYQNDFIAESLKLLDGSPLIKEDTTIVVQRSRHENIPADLKTLSVVDSRRYGDTAIDFLKKGSLGLCPRDDKQ